MLIMTGGSSFGLTSTIALPEMLPLVEFTNVVPATDAVNVTITLPFESVVPDDDEMLPTVPLLTVHDTFTPAIGVEPSNAVALNTCVPSTLRVTNDGETTIEVKIMGLPALNGK